MGISEKLGLGTVQFGLPYGISNKKGQTPANEVAIILNCARLNGIEILDSASGYGNAEEVLGRNDLSGFNVVSKFLPPSEGTLVSDQLQQSLNKLGLNSLYGYLAHRPQELLDHLEHWEEMESFKAQGKVKKIGFSLNEPRELEQLLEKNYIPDLIQVPYNYFDRRFEKLIVQLRGGGCEIHTRSTFLQGLFFIDPNTMDDYFKEIKSILEDLQQNDALNGALLKFVLEKPFIDKVITGVENEQQLAANIHSVENARFLPELKRVISDNILIPSRWPKN